jgi:3-oxoacyl-[acyl-carrier protein] reductase
MHLNLTGKNALVCGSTSGIGKSAAVLLAQAGASVTLLARNADKAAMIVADLAQQPGQNHNYLIADLSSELSLKACLDSSTFKERIFHILVNNNGGPPAGPIVDASLPDFLSALQGHLFANHLLVQAVLAGMKTSGYGRIINIISTSVKVPLKGLGVSNTTRGAVANWAKTLSGELAPYQITVNNVLPGATKTERLSSIITNKAQKTGRSEGAIESEMLEEIPMGRFALAEEIASAIVFLASPQAAYISGTNLVVDGGRTGCL